jgi:hypothetical protein
MKRITSIALIAMVAAAFPACTTSTTTATNPNSTKPIYTTEKRVYSKEELDKRGRQTPGEALAAQDPSITVSHR